MGLDVSVRSLERARRERSSHANCFLTSAQYTPDGSVDLAYSNGVFHRIPVAERSSAINYLDRSPRRRGCFALWENNPWNPGTRYGMHRCCFEPALSWIPLGGQDQVLARKPLA